MTIMTDTARLMDQPGRIQTIRQIVETVADGVGPLLDLYRPYVDGLQHLPRVLPVAMDEDVGVIGGDDGWAMRTAPLGVVSGAVVGSVTGSSAW